MVLPIVAIAWLYVTLLMALTERNFASGLMTFLLYGLFPLAIAVYLLGTPARRQARRAREAEEAERLRRAAADAPATGPADSGAKNGPGSP